MMRLRRIGPMSAARFGFWLGLASIFSQLLVLLLFLTINGIPPTSLPFEFWQNVAWVVLQVSLVTAFSTFMFATIYNWSSDAFGGGLELEFELAKPVEETMQDHLDD
jgi:hypothetical protein